MTPFTRIPTHIEDLLELSRFEASDAPIKGQPIDVAGMAALLRKDVLARPTHPKTVEVSIESAATLIGDEAMVQSAFSNLVDNAAKYTPVDGGVLIRWWTDADGGHFSVRDTGPGFADEIVDRLFEPFFSTKAEGTGMGLAIARSIVEAHGGTLSGENCADGGALFTICLPEAAEARSAAA